MSQQKRVAVRVVVRSQTEEESRRVAAAAKLLLADIVRRVLERSKTDGIGHEQSSRQTLHRSAPVQ